MARLRSYTFLSAWLLPLLIGVWVIATQIDIKNDFSLFLPRGSHISQQLINDQLREGPTSRLLLLAIHGADAPALAAMSRRLAQSLKNSGRFVYVLNGAQILEPAEQQFIFRHRYLLSPQIVAERFTAPALRQTLEAQLRYMRSALTPVDRRQLAADPTNEFLAVINQWSAGSMPEQAFGVWMSRDQQRALLLAATKVPGFDMDGQQLVIQTINEAFQHVSESANAKLEISGPAYFALQARATISREAAILSAAASLAAFALLFFYFRSWWLTFLSVLPVVTAVIVGMLVVGLFYGYLHGITLAFGITMIGVANDYSIHFFSNLRAGEQAQTSVQRIWGTLNLGIFTTIIGFSAFLFSSFEGLAQLGLFTISGLLAAGMVTRWLLPGILMTPDTHTIARWPAEKIYNFLLRLQRYRYAAVLLAVAAGGYIWLSPSPFWENDVANLSPLSSEAKQLDATLRQELGAPEAKELVVIRGRNQEAVLERIESLLPIFDRLKQAGHLGGYDAPVHYLPSIKKQQEKLAALPNGQQLTVNLQQALLGLPFKPEAFAPFVRDVAATTQLFPLEPHELGRSLLGLRLASLLMPSADDHWLGLISLRGPTQPAQIAQALHGLPGNDVYYLDLKAESNRMVSSYRDEGLMLLSWGALGIVLALIIGLGSFTRWLRLSLPIAACSIVTVAVLHALGERLSLFHLVSLVLVFGLSLDYSLFFNRAVNKEEISLTFHAIIICAATTILAFGCLALSSAPVLKAIGITVGLGTFLSFVFAATLVPKTKEA